MILGHYGQREKQPIFPRPFWVLRHWDSLEFVGLPTKESKSCRQDISTLSGCSRMHSSIRIHGYSKIQQDTQLQQDTATAGYSAMTGYYKIHSQSTGYVAGLQDTQPINRIRGWTTGYTD